MPPDLYTNYGKIVENFRKKADTVIKDTAEGKAFNSESDKTLLLEKIATSYYILKGKLAEESREYKSVGSEETALQRLKEGLVDAYLGKQIESGQTEPDNNKVVCSYEDLLKIYLKPGVVLQYLANQEKMINELTKDIKSRLSSLKRENIDKIIQEVTEVSSEKNADEKKGKYNDILDQDTKETISTIAKLRHDLSFVIEVIKDRYHKQKEKQETPDGLFGFDSFYYVSMKNELGLEGMSKEAQSKHSLESIRRIMNEILRTYFNLRSGTITRNNEETYINGKDWLDHVEAPDSFTDDLLKKIGLPTSSGYSSKEIGEIKKSIGELTELIQSLASGTKDSDALDNKTSDLKKAFESLKKEFFGLKQKVDDYNVKIDSLEKSTEESLIKLVQQLSNPTDRLNSIGELFGEVDAAKDNNLSGKKIAEINQRISQLEAACENIPALKRILAGLKRQLNNISTYYSTPGKPTERRRKKRKDGNVISPDFNGLRKKSGKEYDDDKKEIDDDKELEDRVAGENKTLEPDETDWEKLYKDCKSLFEELISENYSLERDNHTLIEKMTREFEGYKSAHEGLKNSSDEARKKYETEIQEFEKRIYELLQRIGELSSKIPADDETPKEPDNGAEQKQGIQTQAPSSTIDSKVGSEKTPSQPVSQPAADNVSSIYGKISSCVAEGCKSGIGAVTSIVSGLCNRLGFGKEQSPQNKFRDGMEYLDSSYELNKTEMYYWVTASTWRANRIQAKRKAKLDNAVKAFEEAVHSETDNARKLKAKQKLLEALRHLNGITLGKQSERIVELEEE